MIMKNIISIVILHTVVYCIKKNFFFISVCSSNKGLLLGEDDGYY